MNARPPVVVIGDALIDEFRTPEGSQDFVGGAALNVAVGLAILGVPTTLVAMVGDDSDGDSIRAFLAEHQVTLIDTPSERGSARAISDRSDGGEPKYLFNDASVYRWIELDERVQHALDDAPLVVISCLRFDSDEQVAALRSAISRPESRLIIDPNPRAGMLHSASDFVRNFEDLAATALLVKVGDEDAELLYNSSLDALVERLVAGGSRAVLATAGKDGATVYATGIEPVRAGITVLDGPIVDTMGAGDSTLSSVTASLAYGLPTTALEWSTVLNSAMAVAAATVRSKGALLQVPPR